MCFGSPLSPTHLAYIGLFIRSMQYLYFVFILLCTPYLVKGQSSLVSRQEALNNLFPGASIASDQIFLTTEQVKRIEEISREKVRGKLYIRFIATKEGEIVGRSYVDTHVVRTKRESLLISLAPDGRVIRIDIIAFLEPPEYLPDNRWLRQYEGRMAGPETNLGRAIQPILGATLSSRAVNSAVRRVQAMDRVLRAPSSQK